MKTVQNPISINISTKELTFKPGVSPATFEVSVVNKSDQFASFQLEVSAAGQSSSLNLNWYNLSPEICSKKPPGDSTKFIVQITDAPVPGFVGQINLVVRVFSIELQEESRELLRLNVEEGIGGVALKLNLPLQKIQAYPNQQVKIPLKVHNPGHLPVYAVVRILGLDSAWLIDGNEQSLQIPSRGYTETFFLCQVPEPIQARSQIYPFKIEVNHPNGLTTKVEDTLQVLPKGSVEFKCEPKKCRIPKRRRFFWRSEPATYQLQFQNQSNLQQICKIDVHCEEKLEYEVIPKQLDLGIGQKEQMQLVTKVKRPWIGWGKKLLIEVFTDLSDKSLGNTNPKSQNLRLEILPLIPNWLAMGGGILLIYCLWWFSWLNPENPFFGHTKAVNSVQFNGLANNLISGSNDQTSAGWTTDGFFNPTINQYSGTIGNAGKAVRVVRYKPVDNDVMAAGLENGEIQLWDLTGKQKLLTSFSNDKFDRIFGLEFTRDSNFLFSGHGSGLVLQWNVNLNGKKNLNSNNNLVRKKQFDFAIKDIKFLGKGDINLVIAGRYNDLVIWNTVKDRVFKVTYPQGGKEDYIESLGTAKLAPDILATSDNQGYITLWNMRNCLAGNGSCEVLDRWHHQKGKPVRSVALSPNACYLASAGDDGIVKLWWLTSDGRRVRELSEGKEVNKSYDNQKMNSVDIKVVDKDILIASGSDDHLVRVAKEQRRPDLGCDSKM